MNKQVLKRVVVVMGVMGLVMGMAGAQEEVAEAVPPEVAAFQKLDSEFTFYRTKAPVKGETNAHCEFDGIAYYNIFDMFLTVKNDPKHPKHAETMKAWETNQAKFAEQGGMIKMMMGNLVPLMITLSDGYAKGFGENTKDFAPTFNPADYVQPMAITVGEGDRAEKVAWFHGAADADGDGVKNQDELLAVAPNWRPVTDENGVVKEGTGLGVTEEDRDKYIAEALGCTNWRKIAADKAAAEAAK